MNTEKQAILDALNRFVNQRSGMDPRNYGDWKSYRQESRSVTKDLHNYRTLRGAVGWRDSITADDLKAAFRAYSGRLTVKDISAKYDDGSIYWAFSLDYCTGQYFPTEYRKAACAVLASALWDCKRKDMPEPLTREGPDGSRTTYLFHGSSKSPDALSAGDWLRASFRREFGRGIASRWFA